MTENTNQNKNVSEPNTGELKKQLLPISQRFDSFMEAEYNDYEKDNENKMLNVLDEAKKEYEAIANETQPNGEPLMLPVYCIKFSKWFKKWFGDPK